MRLQWHILVFVGALMLLAACQKSILPRIRNSEILVKDCKSLFQKFPAPELPTNAHPHQISSAKQRLRCKIPPNEWPNSMQDLRPVDVWSDSFGIYILISTNVRTESKAFQCVGYFVQCNSTSAPTRSSAHGFATYDLKPTRFNGIDEFYEPWAVR